MTMRFSLLLPLLSLVSATIHAEVNPASLRRMIADLQDHMVPAARLEHRG